MSAGELLRDARRRHGLTQRQLAIRARTSQAAISRIERGLVSPTVDTLAELLWLMNERLELDAGPVDWGFDTTLNQSRLSLSTDERVRRGVVHSRRMKAIAESRGVAEPELDPRPILEVLVRHGVDFVVVGGLAGIAHGSAYNTEDVDVAYDGSRENLGRLAEALSELGATLRGAPSDLPFQFDAETLRAGPSFTFDTRYGAFDILGDPAGAPRYDELRAAGSSESLWGVVVKVASLDHLIAMKEAAGRPRDLTMAAEYRTISDLLRAPTDDRPV